MTYVKFNQKQPKSFNNLMDDFFTTMPSIIRDEMVNQKQEVPVNIRETETDYQLDLVAPGMNKEDFKVDLDNNILTISAEVKEDNKDIKYVRREHRFRSIKRSFTLDEKIDSENIVAKYINGVLTLNLPRRQEVKTSAKQISIQ
ncbi:MAG: Hsp20/alpha crystallin family protein [Flavisolibacter sp.]